MIDLLKYKVIEVKMKEPHNCEVLFDFYNSPICLARKRRACSGSSSGLKGKKSVLSSRRARSWGKVRKSRMWAMREGSVSRSAKRS